MELENKLQLYENNLDIHAFEHMLDSPSDCYKFYWLEAILKLLTYHSERRRFTFGEIVNQMIADAYFSVNEYHLSLGVSDGISGLQRAAARLKEISCLNNASTEEEVRNALSIYGKDKELIVYERQMTNMVPYRLLSSFVRDKKVFDSGYKQIADYLIELNQIKPLPYTIEIHNNRLEYEIIVAEEWKHMMLDNYRILKDWISYKKVQYLQDRNPAVPGIIYKIERNSTNQERKLDHARTLWKAIMEIGPVNDIYQNKAVDPAKFALDHFVPWAYIASNELWDLTPIDIHINTMKSDGLPEWNRYFEPLYRNQYLLYRNIHSSEYMYTLYEKCWKDNLLAAWAQKELYGQANNEEQFRNILNDNLYPVWKAAKLQGFEIWEK